LGGAIGVALIGSVMAAGYRSGIAERAAALPGEQGHVVTEGIGGALATAPQLNPSAGSSLIADAQHAFLGGWSSAMFLAAGVSLVAAIAAALLIPRRTDEQTDDEVVGEELAIAA
jgi:hypothetical protein